MPDTCPCDMAAKKAAAKKGAKKGGAKKGGAKKAAKKGGAKKAAKPAKAAKPEVRTPKARSLGSYAVFMIENKTNPVLTACKTIKERGKKTAALYHALSDAQKATLAAKGAKMKVVPKTRRVKKVKRAGPRTLGSYAVFMIKQKNNPALTACKTIMERGKKTAALYHALSAAEKAALAAEGKRMKR